MGRRSFFNFSNWQAYCLLTLLAVWLLSGVVAPVRANQTLRGGVQVETRVSTRGIVGVDLSVRPDRHPIVMNVLPDSPAERAGIRPGDRVLAVNGLSLLGLSRAQVDEAISDQPGAWIQVTLVRRGRLLSDLRFQVVSLDAASPRLKRFYPAG